MKKTSPTLDFEDETVKKIVRETAQIPWTELQRFFASGKVIEVSGSLDLVWVAKNFSDDNADMIKDWMAAGEVEKISDEKALKWIEDEAVVWASVISIGPDNATCGVNSERNITGADNQRSPSKTRADAIACGVCGCGVCASADSSS